ncbi:D-allulose 6-phosphate 3-epimerase [Bacillus safensis]|uniref:D-allulose 6-phosphate 3-epimerase n=1 Tax=Bacillus safensis TaxID=561879 RepID=UPI001BA4A70C|nr:D-allulose 6-phosphate 3-epimerase [Bacillus safensis]MBR0603789.1 ribulose-phosphate 3-epimerase [Bacillus safensis]MCY7710095.1 ribulose-phosphate 3-epimerase [Bacillus safensis]MCY7729049.1 ribulose-phosphate 3-epimerase [Bacillus safensis]MED0884197.1 D-allulose 6-phosphate 3-epimerase [Bacillus safensis]MED0916846.1 D-allulose 6-phosphate 3-epimerase [Bacillus safensis]
MTATFSPSLMCMDLTHFREQIHFLNTRADRYHVDVMDGHYVKNMTLSPFFIEQLRKLTNVPIDVHLMAEHPQEFLIDACIDAGATMICLHPEVVQKDAFRIIRHIHQRKCEVGFVLNPATPVAALDSFIHLIDRVTIMTIDPGFAGQPFIKEMLQKIKQVKDIKKHGGYSFSIEVDGSCNESTFRLLAEAGNEIYIIGTSGLFGLHKQLDTAWETMKQIFSKETASIESR